MTIAEGALSTVGTLALHLAGTFVLRPYVFGFLAIFLVAGWRETGLRNQAPHKEENGVNQHTISIAGRPSHDRDGPH